MLIILGYVFLTINRWCFFSLSTKIVAYYFSYYLRTISSNMLFINFGSALISGSKLSCSLWRWNFCYFSLNSFMNYSFSLFNFLLYATMRLWINDDYYVGSNTYFNMYGSHYLVANGGCISFHLLKSIFNDWKISFLFSFWFFSDFKLFFVLFFLITKKYFLSTFT